MDKNIIIDGVNVAGCVQLVKEPFYPCGLGGECKGWENCYYKQLKRLEQLKNKYYQQTLDDEIQINNLLEEIQQIKQDRNVENITRLSLENKRLEQENEKLKQEVKQIGSSFIKKGDYARELEQENARLKEENNPLRVDATRAKMKAKKYRSALEEILESAKFAQCLPCGSGNLEDCLNCNDDTTNNGQFCMEKRIHDIKTKCVEVLR